MQSHGRHVRAVLCSELILEMLGMETLCLLGQLTGPWPFKASFTRLRAFIDIASPVALQGISTPIFLESSALRLFDYQAS